MKKLLILALLLASILILLAIIFADTLFQNQTAVTTASSARPSVTTVLTTAATTSAPTTTATTTAPTPTPVVTTTAETSPPVTNNERLSWWFIAPEPLNQDIPSNIPSDVRAMVEKYNVIWQAPRSGQKMVYITMDMGYEYNNNTTKILDTALEKDVPITFFVVGDYLDRNPDLILRMVSEGHLVASHSDGHDNPVDLIDEAGEAALMEDEYAFEASYLALTGQKMTKYYRPPSGVYSEQVLDCMYRHGYRTVFWGFAYKDWLVDDQPDPAKAKAKILGQLHDGEILMLHAVSNTNTDLLPELIDEIRARGYEFGRIDEIPVG